MSELSIDWRRCRGHGVCAAAIPEMVTLDQWGYPVVTGDELPVDLRRAARLAQRTCPAAALRVKA